MLKNFKVGFNGGNATGYYALPYSAQGDSYKLVKFGATETAGRWLARVDEIIQYGGCSNASTGKFYIADNMGKIQLLMLKTHIGTLYFDMATVNMIGGMVMNVSGPCFRPNDYITMEVDEEIFDCGYVSTVLNPKYDYLQYAMIR